MTHIRNQVTIPILNGKLKAQFITFHGLCDSLEHVALGLGPWETSQIPLVRLHSECFTGDTFMSSRCDCGAQLQEGLWRCSEEGGILLYLKQEGRGIGRYNKIDAYSLQINEGLDTFSANKALHLPIDSRSYQSAAEMLLALDKPRIRLLTNNPEKHKQLLDWGIDVVEIIPTGTYMNPDNEDYLRAKMKTGHTLQLTKQ